MRIRTGFAIVTAVMAIAGCGGSASNSPAASGSVPAGPPHVPAGTQFGAITKFPAGFVPIGSPVQRGSTFLLAGNTASGPTVLTSTDAGVTWTAAGLPGGEFRIIRRRDVDEG